ncbi:MAG TPA: FAD binding domain-containing protein [Acidimicrobiales bacterium]
MHDLQRAGQRIRRHETPASLEEALRLLDAHGPAARPIAGGTDLIVELDRRVRPGVEVLVDLTRIPGLDGIEASGGRLRLGALVTHNQIVGSAVVVDWALPLAQACLEVGSPALRNRATVAGNLVTASPANDTISALWALDAVVLLRSVRGERQVRVRELFTGLRATVLEPGELIVAIDVPMLTAGQRGIFVKLGQRRAQAISMVHLAVVLELSDGHVAAASLVLGSVAPTVVAAAAAEAHLLGRTLDDATTAEAARLAAAGVTPIDDVRAPATYRSEEIEVMVRRALACLRDARQRERWPARPIFLGGASGSHREPVASVSHDEASPVTCTINGTVVTAAGAAGRTLLDWLRDEIGLTGTKEGCAEGECGACTVHLEGAAVLSCLVPAAQAHGTEVTTIEGLAARPNAPESNSPALHPLQQAFIDQFAVQCGFCIPGFLMAGDRLLQECPRPTTEDVALGLSGNLCRCTGYRRFYAAVEQVGDQAIGQAGAPAVDP